MLEHLDEIDWKQLGAPEVPTWLRNLGSNVQDVRLAAYHALIKVLVPWAVTDPGLYWGSLVEPIKQEALPLAVPFLIELLAEKSVYDKVPILILLREIASYADITDLVPTEDRETYMSYAQKLLKIVSSGSAIYIELAKAHPTLEVRNYAVELLGLLLNLNTDSPI